jgi:hypothetical protein
MPSDCKDFSKTHWYNKFCEYFQIASNFDFPVDMSISVADRPLISSSNGKHKAQGDPDEIRAPPNERGHVTHNEIIECRRAANANALSSQSSSCSKA